MKITIAGTVLRFSAREKCSLVAIPLLMVMLITVITNVKPRYKAEAKFIVKQSSLPSFDRSALRALGRPMRRLIRAKQRAFTADVIQGKEAKLAIIKSRNFLSWLIDERKLAPKLLYKQWDEERQSWQSRRGFKRRILALFGFKRNARQSMSEAEKEQLYDYLAYKVLSGGLRLKRDKNSGAMTLSFVWHDAVFAAEIINTTLTYADRYIVQRERTRRLTALARLNAMAAEPISSAIRRTLFNKIETIQLALSTDLAQDSGVFDVFDPAYPAEKRAFRLPVIRMIIIGLIALFGVIISILLLKIKRANVMNEAFAKI